MIIPDVNLLLYAYNRDSPFHTVSAKWWSDCLSGPEEVGLTSGVIFGFVRVGTHSRSFPRPMSLQDTAIHIEEWLEQPQVRLVEMELRDVHEALTLLNEAGTGGNLTSDAQIAAIALRTGAVVHTGDTDFARFSKVRWFNPIIGRSQRR